MQTAPGTTLIMPIAFDLSWDQTECGPGTKKACEHALAIASETPHSFILTTAARPPNSTERSRTMGEIMQDYTRRRACERSIDVVVLNEVAASFDTVGELFAAFHYAHRQYTQGRELITQFVFPAKSWHAHRVKILAEAIAKRAGIPIDSVCVPRHHGVRTPPEAMIERLKLWRNLYRLRKDSRFEHFRRSWNTQS